MSNVLPNKVDMSLDDIIKLSKFEKRQQTYTGNRGVRQNSITTSGGIPRGGSVSNRGKKGIVGRGFKHVMNPVKQFHSGLQNGRRGQGRGRGRGINRQNSGVSPINRSNIDQQNALIRGRGRGRGGRGAGLVFTNSNIRQQTVPQSQRLNKARQQAALLREKQLAIKNLQQAQKNVQSINMAIQQTARENVVNQLRGVNNIQGSQQGGRRMGRLLPSLTVQGSNNMVNNIQPTRQLTNTSVTINNPSALNPSTLSPAVLSGRKNRRWRRNSSNQTTSEQFTVQVANQNLQLMGKQQPSILNQLKSLKPAISTIYKFQKNVFAAPSTGVSLHDRFSSTTSTDADDDITGERQVFV
ncbi:hypothetical protein BsWGS_03513 [Bradybaena similaris]